jgi:hypothetical protein
VTYNELNKKTLSNEQEEGWVKPSSNANSKAIQLANSIINRVNTIAKDDIEKRNALIKQLRDRLESLAEFELDKKKRDIWINIRRFLE